MTHGFFEILSVEFDKKKLDYKTINTIHNELRFIMNVGHMKIGKSFIKFRLTHLGHQSTFFIEFHKHNSKKPMGPGSFIFVLVMSQSEFNERLADFHKT